MHPNVHCSTIHSSQNTEATRMSINRGMDKDVVHIYNEAIKENEIMSCPAMWMDLEITINEVSQRRTYTYTYTRRTISYTIAYMWNIKNDTNKLIYNTETDS